MGLGYISSIFSLLTFATVFSFLYAGYHISMVVIYAMTLLAGSLLALTAGHILLYLGQYKQKHTLNVRTNPYAYHVLKGSKEELSYQLLVKQIALAQKQNREMAYSLSNKNFEAVADAYEPIKREYQRLLNEAIE